MAKVRSTLEVFLMPVVVVLVGTMGTLVISSRQQESSERLGQTQLQAAREMAAADRQVQVLNLFAEKLASDDEGDKVVALCLLKAVDSELAQKLAAAVYEGEPSSSEVKRAAEDAIQEAASRGNSFAIVGSFRSFQAAEAMALQLSEKHMELKPSVYLSANGYYAVTLGGYLTLREALRRRDYARQTHIADDAYVKTSRTMGDNLMR